MDALKLLEEDHRQVKQLFDRYEALLERGGAGAQRARIARQVVRELSIHASAEEQAFYPLIREGGPELEAKVLEALEEHGVAKWELDAIDRMKPEDERFDAKMKVLIENVRHHIQEEEEGLFPQVRRMLGTAGLELLGGAVAQAKQAAPTRPHPRAPDVPPGNLFAGPLARVIDTGRDWMRGVRRTPSVASPRVRRSAKPKRGGRR